MVFDQTRGWIGVDIGTDAVKLAQIERRGSRIAITEAAVVQRSEPWRNDDNLAMSPIGSSDEILAAHAIGEQFSGRTAAATVPMAICDVRSLQIAETGQAERRSRIAHELASTLHESVGAREFDFWSTEYALEKGAIAHENVAVMSIVGDWARRLADDHRQAKLVCRTLDGTHQALARAIRLTENRPDTVPNAALDWGVTCATFCIVVAGRPIFVRKLRDCGFGQLLHQLQDTLSLSRDEAREVAGSFGSLQSNTDSESPQRMIQEIVAPHFGRLIEEMGRTLTYLKTHRKELLPHQLWLFGGGATMKDVEQVLTDRLGLPTATWSLEDNLFESETTGTIPVALLGPAISLSALAWEKS